jgi:hypothetical protein
MLPKGSYMNKMTFTYGHVHVGGGAMHRYRDVTY